MENIIAHVKEQRVEHPTASATLQKTTSVDSMIADIA